MIVDCIGCLHGARPKLKGGDLLLVTGDLTAHDTSEEYFTFFEWLKNQSYSQKVFISGNHDNLAMSQFDWGKDVDYLLDSGKEFEGLKIWGSPWTSKFEGMNPRTCAFTFEEDADMFPKFELIPDDVDILVTHSPPFTILDLLTDGRQVGSPALMAHHISRLRPKLWAFSHVHESHGVDGPYQWNKTKYVNCSIMNERYEPVNAPIRVVLGD